MGARAKAAMKAGLFYAVGIRGNGSALAAARAGSPSLRKHVRYVARTSRRLARKLFTPWRGSPQLEKQQVLLGRFVDIGTELFAMAATCSRADQLAKRGTDDGKEALQLADYFCETARLRIEAKFDGLRHNADSKATSHAESRAENAVYLRDGIVAG